MRWTSLILLHLSYLRYAEMHLLVIYIQVFAAFYFTDAVTHLEIYPGLQCSYNYDLEVHTHRGERSTKELNFKINARVSFVDFCPSGFYATLHTQSCILNIHIADR